VKPRSRCSFVRHTLSTLTPTPEVDLPYPLCRYIVPAGEAFPQLSWKPIGRCARLSVVAATAAAGASAATGASPAGRRCDVGVHLRVRGGSSTAGTGRHVVRGGPVGGISGWVLTVPSSLSTRPACRRTDLTSDSSSRPARITPPRRGHPDRSAARGARCVHLAQPVDRDQRVTWWS
jgi:hypothetical protein